MLGPGRAVYYAWQDPLKAREFYWTSDEHFRQSNMLREVNHSRVIIIVVMLVVAAVAGVIVVVVVIIIIIIIIITTTMFMVLSSLPGLHRVHLMNAD